MRLVHGKLRSKLLFVNIIFIANKCWTPVHHLILLLPWVFGRSFRLFQRVMIVWLLLRTDLFWLFILLWKHLLLLFLQSSSFVLWWIWNGRLFHRYRRCAGTLILLRGCLIGRICLVIFYGFWSLLCCLFFIGTACVYHSWLGGGLAKSWFTLNVMLLSYSCCL